MKESAPALEELVFRVGEIFTKPIRKYLPSYQCDMCDNEELVKEGSVLPGRGGETGRLAWEAGREGESGSSGVPVLCQLTAGSAPVASR